MNVKCKSNTTNDKSILVRRTGFWTSCMLIVKRFVSSLVAYHLVFYKSNTMRDVTNGAVNTCTSGAHEVIPCTNGVCIAQSLVFCVVFCRSFFPFSHFLLTFEWPVLLLFTMLITLLVSSNFPVLQGGQVKCWWDGDDDCIALLNHIEYDVYCVVSSGRHY